MRPHRMTAATPALLSAIVLLLAACAPAVPSPTAAPAKPTEAPKPAASPAAAPAASPAAAAAPAASPAAAPAAAASPAAIQVPVAPPITKPAGPPRKLIYGNAVTPPNMVHLPAYIAKELGYFDEVGLDVEIKSFEGGVGGLRAGLAGGVDVAGTSADPLIAAVAAGAPARAIGTYAPRLSVVMTSAPDIKTVRDMKGRKAGIQEVGGFNEVMTRLTLVSAGLNKDDVQYTTVSTAGRVPALINGQIDTSPLHIDQYYAALAQKPDLVTLVKMWEVAPDWWYSAFVVTEDKIKNNRQDLVDFMTAVLKAQRFMYAEREKTIVMGMKLTGDKPRPAIEKAYDDLARGGVWSVNDGMPVKMLNYTLDKQVELGIIEAAQKPTADKLVDRSIIEEAIKRVGGPMTGDPRWY